MDREFHIDPGGTHIELPDGATLQDVIDRIAATPEEAQTHVVWLQ